jgi:hypothetical protein
MSTTLPRPGDPDYELVSSAAAKLLMDNRKLAEDPTKLVQETLKLAEQAKKAGLTEIDTYQKGPTGDKVPGQFIDRAPGVFDQNGDQRPQRQPELSPDDAYKILKTAYDQTQAAEAKKNTEQQTRADISARANEVFTPGKAEVKPISTEAPQPNAPAADKDKKDAPLVSVDGKNQSFEALGGVLKGGWTNNDDKTLTARVFHPIEDATITKVGASAIVGQSGLLSAQADVQFKSYRDPVPGKDTTIDVAAGYDVRPGKGVYGQVTYNEGSVGNRVNVKVADGDKGVTITGAATIGTGQTTEVRDDSGKVTGIKREGQVQVAAELEPGKTSVNVGYKTNDEIQANPKAGVVAQPASTSVAINVSDDATKTQYDFNTRLPINGASATLSATHTDSKVGADSTSIAASYGSRDGLNGVRVGYQDTPQGDTVTIGANAGTAKLNGNVTATIAAETTVNAKLNGTIAPNVTVGPDVTYNATTGSVTGKGSIEYANPNGQFAAGLSVGQVKDGSFGAAFTLRSGDNSPAKPFDPSTAIDVASFKVAQLIGDDKRVYDQAVAGVQRLNEGLAKENKPPMPVMETALSLATLADSQKPPLKDIADVQLGKTKDGKEMLIISDKNLEQNPHATRFAIDRQLAGAINPMENLQRMEANNTLTVAPSTQNVQAANDQNRTAQPNEKMDNQVIERETASMRR